MMQARYCGSLSTVYGLPSTVYRLLSTLAMNIVMIGPFGPGGQDTSRLRALPMAQALAARGHSVTLLVPPWADPADAGRAREAAGLRVVHVALPPKLPLLFQAWLTLRLARQALALRPEVVHCFKSKAYSGLACS